MEQRTRAEVNSQPSPRRASLVVCGKGRPDAVSRNRMCVGPLTALEF